MSKIDFKREFKHLYKPTKKEFSVVTVPPMQYLMIDGKGNPNTAQAYKDALQTLYPVAFALKFHSKIALEKDFTVMPLQGLWWAEDMNVFLDPSGKDQWLWTLMIMQPDWITSAMFDEACAKVKKQKEPVALSKLRLESYDEGESVQILHIGSYSEEGPTLAKLHHEFMPANQYTFNGKHHEIYLSDPRRTAPEKLKTILRQPVKKVG